MSVWPRFLIDENLSVRLAEMARHRGYEAIHVNHRGLRSHKDWTIMEVVRSEDWTLVTNNVVEFRARYAREMLHAGVVLFLSNVRRTRQMALFDAALTDIEADPDIVNCALEVDFDGDEIVVSRYALP